MFLSDACAISTKPCLPTLHIQEFKYSKFGIVLISVVFKSYTLGTRSGFMYFSS